MEHQNTSYQETHKPHVHSGSYGSNDHEPRGTASDHHGMISHHKGKPYLGLIPMLISHFVIMFAVMYTMVDKWADVYINLNQFYMTMMMVTPMTIGMLLFMKSMYPNKKLNLLLHGASIIAFALFFYFMRAQSFVGDKQFLKSMIPHHSGAILMCEKAKLADPEIKAFCETIIKTQNDEIATMKEMLKRF
jgi:hypothetical protein